MEEIYKALEGADLDEISEALYGDGAWAIAKALTPAQKKERRDRVLQNVAIGTNAVGSVAGPAAIGLAYRARKTGGMPRESAKTIAPKMQQSKNKTVRRAGQKIQQAADTLDRAATGKGSPKAKLAAGAAAAGLVGMQTVNWGGDMLSAKLINDQKKKDQVSKKSEQSPVTGQVFVEPPKLVAVRLGSDAAFKAAQSAARKKDQQVKQVKPVKKSMDVHWQGEISKMDTEKRQVFGWASIVEIDGKPVVDLQGDIMTVDEIEKAAYDYVKKSRKGGNQHERDGDGPRHVSDLVESFLVTPEKKAQMGLPDSVPTGWWVGFQINDDETWQQVKKGERTEFSIHGSGTRKNVEYPYG